MIKLICFDLDGVLIDACEWHRLALNKALMDFTNSSISIEDHYSIFNGLPTKKKLDILKIPTELAEKINTRKQLYTLEYISSMEKDTQKIELLRHLKSQDIKIACVTNSIRETTYEMLHKSGLINYIDTIVTNQDIRYPKPSAEGYIKAMVLLSELPRYTLIVEDSTNGILAAEASAANVMKVKDPSEVTIENISKYL